MPLFPLSLVCVGRLKTPFWKEAAAHYAARLQRRHVLREILIKDADPSLPVAERKALEGRRILAALPPGNLLICLDEHGTARTSTDFAAWLEHIFGTLRKTPCFIIGGAFGLSPEVIARAHHSLSLGPMTLPHELARVVLLEQLYRADAIALNMPYHHA